MDYFRGNSVNWLDELVLGLLDVGRGRGLHRLGRGLLRPHHHLRGHDVTPDEVTTARWSSRRSLAQSREKSAHSFWSLIFISADVIRVSRSPIKVSAAWQQITSVTNLTPSSSHVTRRASEVWLWHHCDITDNLPMRSVPPRPSCLSLSSLSLRYSDCTPPSTLTDCSFPRLLTLSKHDTSVDNLTGTRGLAGGDHCHWPISGDYRGLYYTCSSKTNLSIRRSSNVFTKFLTRNYILPKG